MRLPQPGEIFEDKYQLLSVLGEGGFARVYRARDTSIGRDVAIKVLAPKNGSYPDRVRKRFMREARVIAELHGQYTVRMYAYGTTPSGLLYLVFEYLEGVDLSVMLRRVRSLPPIVVEHILRQMLGGLAEAHTRGVLHRDIKPANVIVYEHLDDPHRVKLIDFGIAKLFALEGQVDLTKLTADGSVIGTPRYLAPEQFYGDAMPASDIYSCGLVAYEMLFGTPAIGGDSREAILREQLSPAPLEIPRIPTAPHLRSALEAMLQRRPEARPQSAGAAVRLLDDLSSSGSGAITARSGPRTTSAQLPEPQSSARRRPVIAVAAIAALVVVVAVGAIYWPAAREPATTAPARPAAQRATPRSILRGPDTSFVEGVNDAGAAACRPGEPGLSSRTLFRGIEPRPYHVWIPSSSPGDHLPVVLVAHRLFGGDREFIEETKFNEVADEFGFIVISMRFTGDPDIKQMADDFTEAYARVQQEACVDTTRLFAVGHAGGGRHVRKLRCHIELSAIATTSDGHTVNESNCDTEPTPFLHIVGKDDPHLPLDGSASCMTKRYMTPVEFREQWRALNRCTGQSRAWPSAPSGSCVSWTCEGIYVDCIVDGGFDWPHAPEPLEVPGCESRPMDFPIGRTIWRFFADHGHRLD